MRAEQTRSPEYEDRSYTYPRPRPSGAQLKVEESQGSYVRAAKSTPTCRQLDLAP